jgi:CopG family transcriptional regulator, nickel-responsive regulator
MAVVSVSLPDSLLEQADAFITARGFAGRSELVRAALRDHLAREAQAERTGYTSATVTLLYPHGAERRLGEIRHDFTDVIQSMMHGHAEAGCVELFLVRGDADRLRRFVDTLRAAKDAELVQVIYTDVPEAHERHEH